MGTYENFYLNQIKQLQEENKKLKQIIKEDERALSQAEFDGLWPEPEKRGDQGAIGSIWGTPGDWASRGVAPEYTKPLDKQGWFKGKGYLGSPEDIDRRNKAAQRRAADEQKMRAAGFGDLTPLGIGSPPQTR